MVYNFLSVIVLGFSPSGYPIVLPRESESVLLGAAILGAVAAKKYSSLIEAMKALNAAGQVFSQLCTWCILVSSF